MAVGHLAASPRVRGLEDLTLRSYGIGHEAAAVLAAPGGGLSTLTSLNLRHCDLGDEGVRALAESQSLRQLAHLWVGMNGLSDVGRDLLAHSTALVGLKEVWLQ